MKKNRRQAGFTLIEIMVAMAIMALIGVGALKVLDTATIQSGNIKSDGDRLNDVQRTFLMISGDMQQLSSRQVRDEFGDKLPAMKSDQQASAPYVRLTRLGRRNPANLPRSNLEHLIYTVEDETLFRVSYAYVDGMSLEQGIKRPLLDKVTNMKVTFYDGESWHQYWPLNEGTDDAQPQALPVAVKMELELADYGPLMRLFSISDKPTEAKR